MLADLTQADLDYLGVKVLGHRKTISKSIESLYPNARINQVINDLLCSYISIVYSQAYTRIHTSYTSAYRLHLRRRMLI